MTRRDLIMRVSSETGIAQEDVALILEKTLDTIIDSLATGENVEFRNFGVFEVCTRKPRIGRNPKNPEEIFMIPERKSVRFKMGRLMKAKVVRPIPTEEQD